MNKTELIENNQHLTNLELQEAASDVHNQPPSYSDVGQSLKDSCIQSQTDGIANRSAPFYSDLDYGPGDSHIQSQTDALFDMNFPSYNDFGHGLGGSIRSQNNVSVDTSLRHT
ncbi:hypothetical protein Tco_1203127, partial [Tanacetum coccineum]